MLKHVRDVTGDSFSAIREMPANEFNALFMTSSTAEERHLELKILAAYSAAGMLNKVKAKDLLDDVEKARQTVVKKSNEQAAMMG